MASVSWISFVISTLAMIRAYLVSEIYQHSWIRNFVCSSNARRLNGSMMLKHYHWTSNHAQATRGNLETSWKIFEVTDRAVLPKFALSLECGTKHFIQTLSLLVENCHTWNNFHFLKVKTEARPHGRMKGVFCWEGVCVVKNSLIHACIRFFH